MPLAAAASTPAAAQAKNSSLYSLFVQLPYLIITLLLLLLLP